MIFLCNRKTYTLIVSLLLTVSYSTAQNFILSPNEINASVRIDTPSVHEVFIINQLNTPIEMGWDLISNTLPGNWDYVFLYNGSCCPASGMYSNDTLDTISANGQGYLRLYLDPIYNSGTGTLKLWVYETNNPLIGDTVTYTINASPLVIADRVETVSWNIYPNPASAILFVDGEKGIVRVYDLSGSEVISSITVNGKSSIPLRDLPSGTYHITFEMENGMRSYKLFIKAD